MRVVGDAPLLGPGPTPIAQLHPVPLHPVALHVAERPAAEPQADADAAVAQQRLVVRAAAAELLTCAGDHEATLAAVPRIAAATLADWSLLELAHRDGRLERVAVARATGEPDSDVDEILRRAGTQTLCLTLRAAEVGAGELGRLTLVRCGTGFGAAERAGAEELATLAAAAIASTLARREIAEALLVRDRFLSIVSHDLENPLVVIDLNTKLLAEILPDDPSPGDASTLTSEMNRGLARIRRASVRMSALIRELLDVAHLQAGQPLELVQCETDLVKLVRQVVEEFQQEWTDRTIELETAVPELFGRLDRNRIERVFTNLLSNAVKYSRPGGVIHVAIAHEAADRPQGAEPSLVAEVASGGWAAVEVADTGLGIPAIFLPDVFRAFRRAHNVQGRIGGAGIGLASAHQVVTRHGGTIAVESVEGEGSTFTVRLPMGPGWAR